MNFISKNIKKASVINSVLIIIVFSMLLINLIAGFDSAVGYVLCACSLIGLFFGLLYSISGYRKDAAKYYNIFILLYFLTVAVDIYGEFLYLDDSVFGLSMISTYANFARAIPLILLTFVKNFGEKRSKICGYILFGLSLFIFVRTLIVYINYPAYVCTTASQAILSAIICIYINQKYEDKQSRGAK